MPYALAAEGLYALSPRFMLGVYPNNARAQTLRRLGVTHAVNVAHAYDAALQKDMSFAEIHTFPIEDGRRIPFEEALPAVDALYAALVRPHSHVYLHCFVCCNRSPAVAWFYLVALGFDPYKASDYITTCAPQVPSGHADYYGPETILQWRSHGESLRWTSPCAGLSKALSGDGS